MPRYKCGQGECETCNCMLISPGCKLTMTPPKSAAEKKKNETPAEWTFHYAESNENMMPDCLAKEAKPEWVDLDRDKLYRHVCKLQCNRSAHYPIRQFVAFVMNVFDDKPRMTWLLTEKKFQEKSYLYVNYGRTVAFKPETELSYTRNNNTLVASKLFTCINLLKNNVCLRVFKHHDRVEVYNPCPDGDPGERSRDVTISKIVPHPTRDMQAVCTGSKTDWQIVVPECLTPEFAMKSSFHKFAFPTDRYTLKIKNKCVANRKRDCSPDHDASYTYCKRATREQTYEEDRKTVANSGL